MSSSPVSITIFLLVTVFLNCFHDILTGFCNCPQFEVFKSIFHIPNGMFHLKYKQDNTTPSLKSSLMLHLLATAIILKTHSLEQLLGALGRDFSKRTNVLSSSRLASRVSQLGGLQVCD